MPLIVRSGCLVVVFWVMGDVLTFLFCVFAHVSNISPIISHAGTLNLWSRFINMEGSEKDPSYESVKNIVNYLQQTEKGTIKPSEAAAAAATSSTTIRKKHKKKSMKRKKKKRKKN